MIPFAPGGLPGAPITILIEVKNIRSWIYPRTEELYQGLHKASILQVTRPEQQIVPILVCRKAHPTTFWMASQLGFMVIEMGRQFVDAAVAEEDLMEVRNELHFQDLYRVDGPSTRVLDRFQRTLPAHARRFAAIWRDTCSAPEFVALFEALRYTDDDNTRTDLTNRLRQAAAEHGKDGGW
jgi:hypothetical protein